MKVSSISSVLFRGEEKPEVKSEVKAGAVTTPQIKDQPKQDKVEIKKPEAKCEGDACKKA